MENRRSEQVDDTTESAELTDREVEILRCVMMGYPNKVISRHLDISEATVKVHVKSILRKLQVQNRTQAAIWAVNHGVEGFGVNEGKEAVTRIGVVRSGKDGRIVAKLATKKEAEARARFLSVASLSAVPKESKLTKSKAKKAVQKYFEERPSESAGA